MWCFSDCQLHGFTSDISVDWSLHVLCCFLPIFCAFGSGTSQNIPDVISRLLRIGFVKACEIFCLVTQRRNVLKCKHTFFPYWFLPHLLLFPSWLPALPPLPSLYCCSPRWWSSLQAAAGGYVGRAVAGSACIWAHEDCSVVGLWQFLWVLPKNKHGPACTLLRVGGCGGLF